MSRPDAATVAEMFSGVYDVVEAMPWNGLAPTYKAKKDGTTVVLSLLPIDAESSPEAAALFRARADALAKLDHPRLLSVRGHDIRHGVPYLELAFVEGVTLDRLVKEGPLERNRAVTIARRILRALELLEAVDILHLDLTPSNILVSGQDDVRVMGTGIAAILREVRDTDKTGPTGRGSGPSPGRYLPPELMVGDKVDPQSDVYSVGALLHYMLTAHPVNRGGPRPPRDLIPIIDKATREERRDRYPRAASMRLALEANGAPLSVVPPPLPNPAPDAPNLVDEDVLPLDFSQPIRPEPTQDSPALPRWVAALAFVIGLGAAVAGGAWVFGGDAGADADPPTTATATAAETETETATETQTSTETETDPETETTMGTETETETETDEPPLALSTRTDLLSGDLPPPLEVLFPRVVAGEALSTRERHLVERYASEHREDPRPHILLARDFMARGWSSDTIARYREAFAVDPECRADARMLSDLLDLSTRQTSGPSAAQAVARIYGRDALLDVEAMLGGELEGGARRRLEQLQAQLSSL